MTSRAAVGQVRAAAPRISEHWFYGGVAAAAMLTAIAGFAPSLLDGSARRGPVTSLVAVHGALCVAWLVLFALQISLIAQRRIALHRTVGTAALFVGAGLVVVGYRAVIEMVRRGFDLSGDLHVPPVDARFEMVFPLGDLVAFAVLLTLAYLWRRRSAIHKRLMMLATVGGLMPAALAHLIGHSQALQRLPGAIILAPLALFFGAGAAYDRIAAGRIHPVSLWGGLSLFVWAMVRAAVIGPSAWWSQFVSWLAR